jgi:hypothetical protein
VLQLSRPEMASGADRCALGLANVFVPTSGVRLSPVGVWMWGERRRTCGVRCRLGRSRALPLPPARGRPGFRGLGR